MRGGSNIGNMDPSIFAGGVKRSKTSNCHCGLPSCICRCARDVCPKNCRCMKCRRGRKSRRCRSNRCMVSRGGDCGATHKKVGGLTIEMGGGTRRGRPCKGTRRKSTRRKSTRGKRTRRKRRKTLKPRY